MTYVVIGTDGIELDFLGEFSTLKEAQKAMKSNYEEIVAGLYKGCFIMEDETFCDECEARIQYDGSSQECYLYRILFIKGKSNDKELPNRILLRDRWSNNGDVVAMIQTDFSVEDATAIIQTLKKQWEETHSDEYFTDYLQLHWDPKHFIYVKSDDIASLYI